MRESAIEVPRVSVAAQLLSFVIIGAGAAAAFIALSSVAMALPIPTPRWVVSGFCYALFIVPVYLLHRRFSFDSNAPHASALPRYIAVQLSALALATLFSYLAYGVAGLPTPVAATLVIALTSGVNFMVLRLWAFSHPGAGGQVERKPFKFDRKSFMLSDRNSPLLRRRAFVLSHALAKAIPGRGSVLDLGCGDGQVAFSLMRLRPDLKVEGVDIVPRAKTLVPVRQYDGVTLPYDDKSFDYVTIVDVLHHTADPVPVLREACRVAREGVVIKDHLREGFMAQTTLAIMDWIGNFGDGVPMPYNYLSRSEWQEALFAARLEMVTSSERLGIYLPPISWIADRHLHFVALARPKA
ncbi:MAG TPA: methyltransferase domain-containing protein [Devosia sp.]|nr:methyltransferase domain-containing protein [Devosia sp.]